MKRSASADWSALPRWSRAARGPKGGAAAGAFFFSLVWLREVVKHQNAYLLSAPMTAAAAMAGGFALAGAVLMGAQDRVHGAPSAMLLAFACSVPVWIAVATTLIGPSLKVLPVALVASVLSGMIWGLLSRRG